MKLLPISRKRQCLARVSVFLVMAALIAGMAGCGLISQNLEIQTWYDLDDVRNNLGGNHILMNDLDSTTAGYEELASPTANGGKGWEPIGFLGGIASFTGTFDGQGHEIRDLFINRPDDDEDYVGLFGIVGEGGVVRNIGVVNVNVTGDANVGGLVGENEGTVSNSYSTGNITGDRDVGGLVGDNVEGTVSNCYATGNVTGKESGGVGGLVGENLRGTVSNSYATGSVTGNYGVGGLVGENLYGTVSDSYSTGSVTGNAIVGGLVGWNEEGTVSNSCSTSNVTGEVLVGGLVGIPYKSTVSNSYSTGSVTGEECVGGLLGYNHDTTVSNSHYNYDEALINGENIITIGALFGEDFDQWLANNKFLDINERLSQENGYYVVNNVTDFKELLAFGQDNSLKFRLKNDLDLATEPNFYIPYFAGELDGNGHKISNLSFNFDFVAHVGLFGLLASGGKVTQVGVENVNMTGLDFVGGLVGHNSYGTVSNSYSTGSVTGNYSVGGLVGANEGIMSNSYSTGSVTGKGGEGAGGLVGENRGTVSDSYSTGNVSGNGGVGGLVGVNRATVSNSYSTGSVTGTYYVGGLVGKNPLGTVGNSFWDTETSGQATSDGGTGKNTTEMQDIATFSGVGWDIIEVVDPATPNPAYIWNIPTTPPDYPFLSWEP